ncbi:PstS family phosphate ABC transporter substrate-binding protein [Sphingobacterium griseoflavum]|uniref:Phosphate ABC transporter substrate-binding protein n=1 Tax=Sphingobacterium griseoflavum TaxID=1474952 RepID=A0ABQ3HW11_9SPHI|nr:substrate-binding domain-containing protein [Sphingobacterium griseoflavum]GHE40278.1 phosphate ABC transporter substrate-binding protein [Sphingobacterium griseoflavum]
MKTIIQVLLLLSLVATSCSRSQNRSNGTDGDEAQAAKEQEDILVGSLAVAVDESILPLLKEQEEVFLSAYPNAKLNFVAKPEVFAIRELVSGKASVAILARTLNEQEEASFKKRSITPKIFPLWSDGIVVVANTKSLDTSVTIGYLTEIMQGKSLDKRKIVFDNINSSSFRLLQEIGQIDKVASNFVEAGSGAQSVLEAVSETTDRLGILGYNEYSDLIGSFPNKNNIRILSVQNTLGENADNKFYMPNQSTIAAGEYPLQRTFYVLNYQPNLGLGIGFSAFLTGDRGQRIVLKAGLVPATMPGREIIVRDNI